MGSAAALAAIPPCLPVSVGKTCKVPGATGSGLVFASRQMHHVLELVDMNPELLGAGKPNLCKQLLAGVIHSLETLKS